MTENLINVGNGRYRDENKQVPLRINGTTVCTVSISKFVPLTVIDVTGGELVQIALAKQAKFDAFLKGTVYLDYDPIQRDEDARRADHKAAGGGIRYAGD